MDSLKWRFGSLDILGAFHVLGPQVAIGDKAVANLLVLSKKFQTGNQVLPE